MTDYEKHCCRVCGLYYPHSLPYGETGDCPTFDFCDCCGVEWGYQDCQPSAARGFRLRWIKGGAIWANPEAMPIGWNFAEQTADIPSAFV